MSNLETTQNDSTWTPPEFTPAKAGAGVTFCVTDSAAARIIKILDGEPEGTYFSVNVDGGGCSGFQYKYNLVNTPIQPTDLVLEKNGAKVVVDEISLGFLKDSTLDYVEDLASAGFEIKNPNATAKCGCGNSFSV